MAKATYEDAIALLNSCGLRQSLELVSQLSSVEFDSTEDSPFSLLLNCEKIRLIAEGIVKSKAAWYKQRPIKSSDLPTLLNGAGEALEDKRLYEIVSGGERQEMLYMLQRYFSRLAYIQIRPQQAPFVALGRTIAILETIPARSLFELPSQLQPSASRFHDEIRKVLGLSVGEIAKTHLAILEYFGKLGRLLLQRLPSPRVGRTFNVREQGHLLGAFVAASSNSSHFFCLTRELMSEIAGDHVGKALSSYAKLFGRPMSVHRELLGRWEYKVGPEEHRLSPLDRFPLVTAEGKEGWYVPNVRGLARSASEVIHFTLNELCRESYQAVRGVLLEVYLRLMLNSRAPRLVVLQEKRWPSSKGGVDGPDLLIIDHSDEPVVIAIEVKSRRMVPGTRYDLLDEQLVDNYEDLWKALKKLPGKVAEVYSLAGEYENHKEDLILARNYPVLYLGVAGEAPYLFGELAGWRSSHDPSFPLYGFNERFGVMSVDVFEKMLEVSVQGDRPIASVLRDYLEDCKDLELSSPMAEDFRGARTEDSESFGFSFVEPFWPDA